MNRAQLLSDLEADEGFRPYIYDDATGAPVLRGYVLRGKATLGIGWCPETNPLPHDKALIILGWHVDDEWGTLLRAVPWVLDVPEPQQRALANLAFQLGVTGLLKFTTFISLMQQGRYGEAADDIGTTLWAEQSGTRAGKIQVLIKQGHV